MERQFVSIIGAGLTGSLLAILLARRGFSVIVYERQADMRCHDNAGGRSINLAMSARGLRAIQRAGLYEQLLPMLVPMRGRMLHQESGELELQAYGQRPDEIIYSVSRADLNALLLNAAETAGVEIRFEQSAESLNAERRCYAMRNLATGESYELAANPVIAADGAGSPTRRALQEQGLIDCSEELLEHGYKELSIAPGDQGGFRLDANALHIWPRGGFMLIALPNPAGDFTVTLFYPNEGEHSFASLNDDEDDDDAIERFFGNTFPDVPPLMPDLLQTYKTNPVGVMGTVRCNRWHLDGDVLLIGDAAHAIVPFHGQGMNLGFEDCIVLDDLLDDSSYNWQTVFELFEAIQLDNANAIATMAVENYIEMRDTVRDPKFHLRKALAFELERMYPDRFIPRYSMVMFHPEIPYATAERRGKIQHELLDELTQDCEQLSEIDLNRAKEQVLQRLKKIPIVKSVRQD